MRFAIYLRSVETARGAERVAVNVARGLAERAHHIDFLLEESGAWLTEHLRAQHDNVHIINLRARQGYGISDRLLQVAVFVWHLMGIPGALLKGRGACIGPVAQLLYKDAPPIGALRRYLNEARPRAILSFLNYPNAVLLLAAPFSHGETRLVVSVRNHISVAADNSESKWMRTVPKLMRRFFHRADAVVAPSQGVADDVVAITQLPPERVTVVYNPVFRPELETLAAEPVHHPWLAEGNIPVIIGAGKFKPQKDFPTLLRAFAKVRAERRTRLLILGNGQGGDELKRLAAALGIAEDVDFPGHVENPFAFYSRASVFVLSSMWEGLPNVLIEAMACGCPVVSTDCPSGPREILDGGRFGPLVPVGADNDLAAAILATLGNPPARAQMIERARTFSLDQAVVRFEAVMAG